MTDQEMVDTDESPPIAELEDAIHELSQLQGKVNSADLHLNCVILGLIIKLRKDVDELKECMTILEKEKQR